jgi:hypothetical protein
VFTKTKQSNHVINTTSGEVKVSYVDVYIKDGKVIDFQNIVRHKDEAQERLEFISNTFKVGSPNINFVFVEAKDNPDIIIENQIYIRSNLEKIGNMLHGIVSGFTFTIIPFWYSNRLSLKYKFINSSDLKETLPVSYTHVTSIFVAPFYFSNSPKIKVFDAYSEMHTNVISDYFKFGKMN